MKPHFTLIASLVLVPHLFTALTALAIKSGTPKICITGDAGHTSGGTIKNGPQAAVGTAMDRAGCTHVIALGDNFYPRGVTSANDSKFRTLFEEPYQALLARGVPFYMVLGNHDYLGNVNAELEYAVRNPGFVMPAKNYAFKIEGAPTLCFFVVDTTYMTPWQGAWLKSQLKSDSTCRHKVVLGHHPILSSGKHGNTGGAVDLFLKPALEDADMYLAGHDHHMSDEGFFKAGNRQVRQLVSGAGGAPLREVPVLRGRDYRFGVSAFGFLVLDGQMNWTFYNTELQALYSANLNQ